MSEPGAFLRQGALWGLAASVVLAAHLGGALWLLHRATVALPPGLPDPILVELAPIPESAAPPAPEDSEEIAEAAPEPAPEPALPEPPPAPEPVPEMNTPLPPPPDAVVLQKSERPKDRPRPEPQPESKPVQKKPDPPRQKQAKAPEEQQARKAATQLRAPQGARTASTGQGQPSARQVATWQSKVQSAVARHMRRTGNLRRGGVTVMVAFTISANGTASNGRLASSTGDARTDAALARQVARLPRMPPHPSGKAVPISFPVRITN